MLHLFSTLLCHVFESTCGRKQLNRDPGYRHLELAIWAPTNYVQVWTRESWVVIPVDDLEYSEDGDAKIKPGKNYSSGATEWVMHSDHDSCWRDGVATVLDKYRRSLITFSGFKAYENKSAGDFPFVKADF